LQLVAEVELKADRRLNRASFTEEAVRIDSGCFDSGYVRIFIWFK
jgi:hypothetical protein